MLILISLLTLGTSIWKQEGDLIPLIITFTTKITTQIWRFWLGIAWSALFLSTYLFSLSLISKYSHTAIISGIRVQWELNILTIQLDEQKVSLSHLWPGRRVLLFFPLGHSDRHLSLRDPGLAPRMCWRETMFNNLLIYPELGNTI